MGFEYCDSEPSVARGLRSSSSKSSPSPPEIVSSAALIVTSGTIPGESQEQCVRPNREVEGAAQNRRVVLRRCQFALSGNSSATR